MTRLKQLARYLTIMWPWSGFARTNNRACQGYIVIEVEAGDLFLGGVSTLQAEETLRLCLEKLHKLNQGSTHQCSQNVH